MKREFNEALGVPDNLVNVAKEIYDDTLNSIDPNLDFEELNDFDIDIDKQYTINDVSIGEVEFQISLNEYDGNIELIGMSTSEKTKVTNDFKIEKRKSNKFNIEFRYACRLNTTGEDIINHIKSNRLEYVASIAHEVKHYYDGHKKPINNLVTRVQYDVASSESFANINPINEFLHYIYYSHVIESLVRPTEIAALIDAGEIDKKGFYKFLTSTRTYQRLNDMRNFSYELLKEKLMGDYNKIIRLLDRINFDYEGMSKEEVIENVLRLVYINFRNWKHSLMVKRLTSDFFEAIAGFSGAKQKFLENYEKILEKFGNDYEKFFRYEIKLMNKMGDKMIRKIGKVYDLARETQNESIINWELWKLINENKRPTKIETELKYRIKPENKKPKKK